MTAIKRKFLMPALMSAITAAALASCSTGGATEVTEGAVATDAAGAAAKQAAAPSTGAPSAGPFAGLDAARIAQEALAATRGARSLRLTAEGTNDGRLLKVDFSLDERGTCTGGLRRDDSEAEFTVLDGVTYLKGDDEFWRAVSAGGNPDGRSADPGPGTDPSASAGTGGVDQLVELLRGKWLKIPAGEEVAGRALGGACDLDAMLNRLDTAGAKGLTRGAAAEVDGRKAVTLVKRQDGVTSTTFVAAEGAPYLLRSVSEGGAAPGTVLFRDFGVPVSATAPPAAEVVDLRDTQP
ncbi:hypothetical protein SSPS47_23045 [Streptomyces sp. S4.7]|uniref:hypothetical protein n=1 Tax=Streptomyces sp. S4.7 TaxID=2705439 RepID=UPI00139970E0|nr:hypothetical protein [Streptomyces sp. S4.7]QHY97994.1 hypothetical protein SSPS47_23045 [Streptomyces sp. S4.7]